MVSGICRSNYMLVQLNNYNWTLWMARSHTRSDFLFRQNFLFFEIIKKINLYERIFMLKFGEKFRAGFEKLACELISELLLRGEQHIITFIVDESFAGIVPDEYINSSKDWDMGTEKVLPILMNEWELTHSYLDGRVYVIKTKLGENFVTLNIPVTKINVIFLGNDYSRNCYINPLINTPITMAKPENEEI